MKSYRWDKIISSLFNLIIVSILQYKADREKDDLLAMIWQAGKYTVFWTNELERDAVVRPFTNITTNIVNLTFVILFSL